MKRLFRVACGVALAAAASIPAQAQTITSKLTNMCARPEGFEDEIGNGSVIRQFSGPCFTIDNPSRWGAEFVIHADGRDWYRIVNGANPHSGHRWCLDLTNGNTADGTALQLWDCTGTSGTVGSTTMLWNFQTDGRIRNFRSRKCMDVRGGSFDEGAVIQNFRCTDLAGGGVNLAQLWQQFIVTP